MKFFLFMLLCAFSGCHKTHAETRVLALAGSAAHVSVNKQLVTVAADITKSLGADVKFLDLKNFPIPLYNADLEAHEGMPQPARLLQQLFLNSDVILIATPEYNNSTTPILLNLLDWCSRKPEGGAFRDAFKGKTFVIMSATPGFHGGVGALETLRTVLAAIGGSVLPQQFSLSQAYQAFDENGKLKNPNQQAELKKILESAIPHL